MLHSPSVVHTVMGTMPIAQMHSFDHMIATGLTVVIVSADHSS